jgi:alcohol dehydrogenase (cytochrome c)
MQASRRLRNFSFIAVLVLGLLTVAIVSARPVRLRAIIFFDKAAARLNDVEWSDMRWLLGRDNGVDFTRLAETRNPYESIESPRRSKSDLEIGSRLFREQCSPCHGEGGIGGPGGPSLQDRVFRQGRSDWALYRTITHGIPGTAMFGRSLPRDDTWKLVSYLKQVLVDPVVASTSTEAAAALIEPVTGTELRTAGEHPAEWLTYSGSYSGYRHSLLTQINRHNVAELRVEWERQLGTPVEKVETTPLVRGSTMFLTEPPNRILALDAASGRVLWTYSRDLPSNLQLCCGPVNRGVAVLGSRVFVGTLDAHLVALDANTGKIVWDVAVGDSSKGYSITGAPLAIEDMVVTGVGGGEYGIRGFIDAYDAATGKRRWRFYTVPAPGEPGSETWEGTSLRNGGAPTWLTGSFDPELRLIYWGVGNPSPNFYGANRKGDNLYTNSVVALDADSGKLRWHFQFTPHDLYDRDAVQIPVLVDTVVDGYKRRLMACANRNGFYYLLDRTTGKFLLGAPFVKQTWADGLDADGRPKVRPESLPTPQGAEVYPGIAGGTNWWPPTYDPESELMYVPTVQKGAIFFASPQEPVSEKGETIGGTSMPISNEDAIVAMKAIDVTTGRIRWQFGGPRRKTYMEMSGLMSTAGKLVFGGDGEKFFAVDAETGAELWHFATGAQIQSAAMTYELGGRQYIAVAAGRAILTFTLPKANTRGNAVASTPTGTKGAAVPHN